ncbi:MAG TPA: tetratricopeptide repeat protein [Methylomirabilota bacterium]|nr:tetratricopeptide repeat protein [Methylomirabilota bacterium]
MTVALVALLLGLPAAAFTLWPLLSGRRARALLAVPPDPREPLLEQRRHALLTLRELDFEHEAGHVSDDDYADLRARYEAETAQILTELDRLGPEPVVKTAVPRASSTAPAPRGFRHPLALAASAVALVVFGVVLGVGIVRYSEPDATAGMPGPPGMPGAGGMSGPGGMSPAGGSAPMAETPGEAPAGGGAPRPVSPEMLRGMLEAARSSLGAGRYGEAIAAYQAVLKRDPNNVDAMTHLGLIVAIGGHADSALQTFDKALAIDPNYAPALLYRGQVLYESKRDAPGAIASWEKFLKLVPAGQDHERVKALIAEARKPVKN